MTSPYRAVLFDLDGTLLDTLDDIGDSMNAVLAELSAPPHDREAYRGFIGDGVEMLVLRALPAHQADDGTVRWGVGRMREIYGQRWDQKSAPYPGIPGLLDRLTGLGIRLAVLSNKPHHFVTRMVERMLSSWHLAPVLGAREGVPKKPDPEVALRIAAELEIPPGSWLFLGDSGIDMQTARAAGMTAAGVRWGFRGAEELEAAGAQHLLTTPEELLALL
jgi:phosphoglycolate phosphatase